MPKNAFVAGCPLTQNPTPILGLFLDFSLFSLHGNHPELQFLAMLYAYSCHLYCAVSTMCLIRRPAFWAVSCVLVHVIFVCLLVLPWHVAPISLSPRLNFVLETGVCHHLTNLSRCTSWTLLAETSCRLCSTILMRNFDWYLQFSSWLVW